MKILSYSLEGDMVRVITDNPGRPDFVYHADSFDSLESLYAEIEKSIHFESVRNSQRQVNLDKLVAAVDSDMVKD